MGKKVRIGAKPFRVAPIGTFLAPALDLLGQEVKNPKRQSQKFCLSTLLAIRDMARQVAANA